MFETNHVEIRGQKPGMTEKLNQNVSMLLETGDESVEQAQQKAQNLRMTLDEFEKQLLIDALKQNQGHRERTAMMLGIDRKTLYLKMKKYTLE